MNQPSNRHGVAYHSVLFYGGSFLLGYSLFRWFPYVYIFAGFTPAASVMYIVAMINIHHFIVDGFIWRLKKADANRGIIDSAAPTPA